MALCTLTLNRFEMLMIKYSLEQSLVGWQGAPHAKTEVECLILYFEMKLKDTEPPDSF